MKAEITSPIKKPSATDEYSIHLVPESDNESKLLSALFEKFVIDGAKKRFPESDVYYAQTLDGNYTTHLKITIVNKLNLPEKP